MRDSPAREVGVRWPHAVFLAVLTALGLGVVLAIWVRQRDRSAEVSVEVRQRVGLAVTRLARPGPLPEDPAAEARRLVRAGQVGAAAELWRAALARDRSDPDALLGLAILAFRADRPLDLLRPEAEAVVEVVGADAPDAAALPAARAWMRVVADDPLGAIAALERAPDTPDGLEAHLRALELLGQDPSPVAARLLALEPDHGGACVMLARGSWAAGDLPRALTTVEGCVAAGADSPGLWRICGEVFDRVGAFEAAAARHVRAGATLHAAAVIYQEGLADPSNALAALDEPAPPAILHRGWRAVMGGDRDAVARAARELRATGAAGPQFDTFLVIAALEAGAPADALAQASLDAPAMTVARARARAMLGEAEPALHLMTGLIDARPWRLDLRRAAMAIHPSGAEGMAQALLGLDPVLLWLARDMREREMPWPAVVPTPWPALDGVAGASLALVSRGEWDAAVWDALPPDPDAQELRLGALAHGVWAALRAGDLAAAESRLSAAEALAPPEPPPLVVLRAELLRQRGQAAQAVAQLVPLPDAPGRAWALASALGEGSAEDRARGARIALDAAIASPELSGLWALGLQLGLPAGGPSLDSRCPLD